MRSAKTGLTGAALCSLRESKRGLTFHILYLDESTSQRMPKLLVLTLFAFIQTKIAFKGILVILVSAKLLCVLVANLFVYEDVLYDS